MTEQSQVVRRRNHPATASEGTAFFHSWTKALLCILFMGVVLTLWALQGPHESLGLNQRGSARLAIIFFVIGAGSLLWIQFSTEAVLIVGPNGVLIPRLNAAVIPWSEIRSVHRRNWPLKPMIWLELRNPERFVASATSPRGFASRITRGFFTPQASLDTYLLKGGTEKAYETIERYRSEAEGASSSRR